MKEQRRNAILIVVVLLVIALIIKIIINAQDYKTYSMGDYGVEITVPRDFEKYKTTKDSQILYLEDAISGLTISVTQLRGDFWKSGDVDAIVDQYLNLIGVAMYDRTMKDVETGSITINGEKVGKVTLTLEQEKYSNKRSVTLLTQKSHGYLAIEIYGDTAKVNRNEKKINSIIKTIKFKENKHNYDKDIAKEISKEEEEEAIDNLYKLIGASRSGEFSGERIYDLYELYSGELKK